MTIKRLGIGLPLTDQKVFTNFFTSFILMEKPAYTLLLPRFPGPIDHVRNDLVKQAIAEKCSHLLLMDTDQVYPADTVKKMCGHFKNGSGVQVVGGRIHRRYPPFDPILYAGSLGKYTHVPDEQCYSGELIEVDATGCGCIMYDMYVFEDTYKPWFKISIGDDGKTIGEDIAFCAKMRAAGIKIFVDTSIDIGHLSLMNVNRDTYELYKGLKGFGWRPPPEKQQNGGCEK